MVPKKEKVGISIVFHKTSLALRYKYEKKKRKGNGMREMITEEKNSELNNAILTGFPVNPGKPGGPRGPRSP